MKSRILKYILSLSVMLLVFAGQLITYNTSSAHTTAGAKLSQSDNRERIASINSYSSLVFKKSESKFTTSESDEEEISSSGKKFLKTTGSFVSVSQYKILHGYFEPFFKNQLHNYRQLISYSPQRLYIKNRVLRL